MWGGLPSYEYIDCHIWHLFLCFLKKITLNRSPATLPPVRQEFFAELKAFIRRNWHRYDGPLFPSFTEFLEWCVDTVGAKARNAQGHFRHAGLAIEFAP